MTSKPILIEKNWHLKEREPDRSRATRLRIANVDPAALEMVKTAPAVMSAETAAKLLDFSKESIAEWCREGRLEGRKVGRMWRISREALARFIIRGNL